MTSRPAVAVSATTEVIRGVLRVRGNASYTGSLHSAGLRPYILPVLAAADADAMLDGVQGLVLTGGEDVDPKHYGAIPHAALGDVHAGRDAFELALVLAARARRLPTLAICRGIQVVNVALGGTLVQDIPSEWPAAIAHDGAGARGERIHDVDVDGSSQLASALGAIRLTVNSFHHQSIAAVAPGLSVVARAPDGVIEGVQWTGDVWWMLGVQWHPEELTGTSEAWDRNLFRAFASACEGQGVS
ncbi:gamma-glutamyl-gamma-aminobutyrate hydrolase family protein [soil metagenome]